MKLTDDLLDLMNQNGEFENIKTSCPCCQGISYEQYTCSSCWQSGGSAELSIIEIIENLNGEKESYSFSLNDYNEILENINVSITIYKYNYPEIELNEFDDVDEYDNECSYSNIFISDILRYVLNKNYPTKTIKIK